MSSSEVSPRHVRPDMVQSAISFLKDPKVQQSNVSQRISFLESKGLSPDEIDEALRQTGSTGAITAGQGAQAGPSHGVYAQQQTGPVYYNGGAQAPPYYMSPYAQQQQHQQGRDRDWRDWFIMAVVSGTVGYGVISLARKYLFPHLQPPNQTVLEEDRDALTAKYDEVAEQLAALDTETKAIKLGIEQQREAVEKSIKEVEETVVAMRDADKKRASDMDGVKSDVDAMKRDMERMFEKTREAQTASLTDLQNELKSLKSLLASRGGAGSASAPRPYSPFTSHQQQGSGQGGAAEGGSGFTASNSMPSVRPSIPAWQLAESSSPSTTTPAEKPASTSGNGASNEPTGISAAQAGSQHAASGSS